MLGSGPIRDWSGHKFDYSTVHAVKTIRNAGYTEAIAITTNNPETVSTDYTTSDKHVFSEPLCVEDATNGNRTGAVPDGVTASLGRADSP